MSSIPKLLNSKEVCELSRRGINRVRIAANTGALRCQPRIVGAPMLFTEANVADWIEHGSPEMPAKRRRSSVKKPPADATADGPRNPSKESDD